MLQAFLRRLDHGFRNTRGDEVRRSELEPALNEGCLPIAHEEGQRDSLVHSEGLTKPVLDVTADRDMKFDAIGERRPGVKGCTDVRHDGNCVKEPATLGLVRPGACKQYF